MKLLSDKIWRNQVVCPTLKNFRRISSTID